MALLSLRDVVVSYGDTPVLNHLSLEVQPRELVALLGPSGSGKTTLLNAVAGFIELNAGEIRLGETLVSRPGYTVPPERRRVGVVFQSFALWPHMTVLDTVAYPFRQRGISATSARDRARDLLRRVGLLDLAARHPAQLSGGQQQRVGLARALAVEPALFLFDEPTANLDPSLRASLQAELRQTQRDSAAGGLYVTHDPAEALAISDKIAVLRHGHLVQQGLPEHVYTCPVDEWVATLTGPASILSGQILSDEEIALAGVAPYSCLIHSARPIEPGPSRFCVRPEWVLMTPLSADTSDAIVKSLRFQGPHTDYELGTSAGVLIVRRAGPPRYHVGERVGWRLEAVAAL